MSMEMIATTKWRYMEQPAVLLVIEFKDRR